MSKNINSDYLKLTSGKERKSYFATTLIYVTLELNKRQEREMSNSSHRCFHYKDLKSTFETSESKRNYLVKISRQKNKA
jgi:hypothetical protein